jgi:hypothetical protein
VLLLTGLLLAPLAAARAQGTGAGCASEFALGERLGAPARGVVESLADSARRAGLPGEAVCAKAAEGALKGATDARIVVVVRQLARELGEARAELGAAATEADLVAGASALHAGIPARTLRRLREVRERAGGATSLAAPLVVLADLVARQVPLNLAVSSVDTLVARGARAEDFAALRADVERDVLAGRRPDEALTARTRALLGSRPPRD